MKNKKRVMLIHNGLVVGGMEKMITWLANVLSNDYDVNLLLLEKHEHNFVLDKKITVIEKNYNLNLSLKSMGVFSSVSLMYRVSKEIRRCCKNVMPDIVIVFNDRITFLTLYALKNMNIKLLASQRADPDDKSRWINWILKYVYHHYNGVVFQLEQVKSYYHMDARCRIIPNPAFVKVKDFLVERSKKIISIGRLQGRKRMDLVIEAFQKVLGKYPDYELYIFGDGEEKDKLKCMAKKLGIYKSVYFMGFVSDAAEKYKDAEMFVMASDSEGIPNTLIEAMAAGIPCIATDCSPGGAEFLLNHGKNGILVSKGDIEGLAGGMIKYIEDKELGKRNAVEAQRYLDNFNADLIYGKWKMYIDELLLENGDN